MSLISKVHPSENYLDEFFSIWKILADLYFALTVRQGFKKFKDPKKGWKDTKNGKTSSIVGSIGDK